MVRNRIEIIAQILEVVNEGSDDGVTKTKIMYKAFLNYAQLKEYLTILTDNRLLSYDVGTQTFKTSKKALMFLKACNQLDQLTKE
ncbi:MAG TPA: winged helix-turn-helix domain-containing protein [Nitrososphaera sp.]|nr:winged helix-turn-helix domain-containing protein [Nitrososphaera sp.]